MNAAQFQTLVFNLKDKYRRVNGRTPNVLIIPLAKSGEVRDAVRDLIKYTNPSLLVRGELPPTIFGLKPVFSEYAGTYAVDYSHPVPDTPFSAPSSAEEVMKLAQWQVVSSYSLNINLSQLDLLSDVPVSEDVRAEVEAALRAAPETGLYDVEVTLSGKALSALLAALLKFRFKDGRYPLLSAAAEDTLYSGPHTILLTAEALRGVLAGVAPQERREADNLLCDVEQRSAGVVNAVWSELSDRGLDIQELVGNSDRKLLGDVYEGLRRAVVAGFSNPPAHPFEEG